MGGMLIVTQHSALSTDRVAFIVLHLSFQVVLVLFNFIAFQANTHLSCNNFDTWYFSRLLKWKYNQRCIVSAVWLGAKQPFWGRITTDRWKIQALSSFSSYCCAANLVIFIVSHVLLVFSTFKVGKNVFLGSDS